MGFFKKMEDGLLRYSTQKDIDRFVGKGLDRLPVSDLTKQLLKQKAGRATSNLVDGLQEQMTKKAPAKKAPAKKAPAKKAPAKKAP